MVDDMLDLEAIRPNAQQLLGKIDKIFRRANSAAKDWKRQTSRSSGQSQPKTPPISPMPSLRTHSQPPEESSSPGRPEFVAEFGSPAYGSIPRCDSPSRRTTVNDSQSFRPVGTENGSLRERPLSTSDLEQPNNTRVLDEMLRQAQGGIMTPPVSRRPPLKRKKLSELSVQEVQDWMIQKKTQHSNPLRHWRTIGGPLAKNKLSLELPNMDLLKQLKNRDHVSASERTPLDFGC